MSDDVYLLIVSICNVVGAGINIALATRNMDIARFNAAMAKENAETAERLMSLASKQGVFVLQRNK